MIKSNWLSRNLFSFYVILLCLQSLSLTAATHEGVYQTDTLDFVPSAHRSLISSAFYRMMGDVSVALKRDIAPHKQQLTLLSEACLLWFKADGAAEVIYADRGRDEIRTDKGPIPLTNRNIFRASDRRYYQANKIKEAKDSIGRLPAPDGPAAIAKFFTLFAGLDKEFSMVMQTIADRRSAIEANMTSYPLPILTEVIGKPSDPSKPGEPIAKYVEDHIDDGEGAAVDYLVMQMQDGLLESKLKEAVAIYPLVYTENDPCRCCLLSICPHLTGKIRRINLVATIIPIVVAASVYHEKSEGNARKVALRYHYPWWPPEGLSLEVPATAAQEAGVDAEPDVAAIISSHINLYLYHMPTREVFTAINTAELAMGPALPSVTVASRGVTAVSSPPVAGAGAGGAASASAALEPPPSGRRGKGFLQSSSGLNVVAAGAGAASVGVSASGASRQVPDAGTGAALGASPFHDASTSSTVGVADEQEAKELEQALKLSTEEGPG